MGMIFTVAIVCAVLILVAINKAMVRPYRTRPAVDCGDNQE